MKKFILILMAFALFACTATMQQDMVLKIALAETLARSNHVEEIHQVAADILNAPEEYDTLLDLSEAVDAQIDEVFLSPAGRIYAKQMVKEFGAGIIDRIAVEQVVDKADQVAIALEYIQFVYDVTVPAPPE